MTSRADTLFEAGRQTLRALRNELTARQVYLAPELELRRGQGLLCHYDLHDGHIYLSVPDANHRRGKFETFFLRAIVDLSSNHELLRFLELLIPWLIAHEVGHHLRHKYGLLDFDRCDEEQIANQLAAAFTKRWLTAAQQQELREAVARVVANLSTTLHLHAKLGEVHSTQDAVCYVYSHLRWIHHNFREHDKHSMDRFVQLYLS